MDDVIHISVDPGEDRDPQRPPRAVYVDGPEPDLLDEPPFATGRHRLERLPGDDAGKPPATLWSWTEGDG
jgi:hypothetical protein